MTDTTDRAALIAEAAEYPTDSDWCGNLIQDLAAALADSERELEMQSAMAARATDALAHIASLDISATSSIEQLVAPWRRLDA